MELELGVKEEQRGSEEEEWLDLVEVEGREVVEEAFGEGSLEQDNSEMLSFLE